MGCDSHDEITVRAVLGSDALRVVVPLSGLTLVCD
jgi:hypothetical protein